MQGERSSYAKIHDENSIGNPSALQDKSGVELSNDLKLGGYKYLFMNLGHPIGNFVLPQIYPDFSYLLYQNGSFVLLAVNGTNYAEKVDLVEDVDDEVYTTADGYKYTTISRFYDPIYGSQIKDIDFKEIPTEPEPLKFERPSTTTVRILGDFDNNDWVVFKDKYFSR